MPKGNTMSRKINRTPQSNYSIQFESEGRRWCESHKAGSIYDAELHAANQARSRRIRVIVTLPLNPEV